MRRSRMFSDSSRGLVSSTVVCSGDGDGVGVGSEEQALNEKLIKRPRMTRENGFMG